MPLTKIECGRIRQSKATNLIGRLRDYSDDVWRFMAQGHVPFTNNLAEQAVRMPKVKQKVSGCFRTPQGVKTYCVIRSYCATLHKQGPMSLTLLSLLSKAQRLSLALAESHASA